MKSEVLHVVVGAGNIQYFRNAIQSIKHHNAGDIFAVYNWVDAKDLEDFSHVSKSLERSTEFLRLQRNNPTLRTGSLYDAYNLGLEEAKRNYRFASFMQADMQLMWWHPKIMETTEELVAARSSETEYITFYTQLPIIGKHPQQYKGWLWGRNTSTYVITSHSDVCMVPLYGGINEGFSFEGTEHSMAVKLRALGAELHWHPFPFVAAIPYPRTVRDRPRWYVLNSSYPRIPILSVAPEYEPDFSKQGLHPLSMENSVVPNGWVSSYPYWPSDTRGELWISRRIRWWKRVGGSLFSTIDSSGVVSCFSFRFSKPGNLEVFRSLLRVAWAKFKSIPPKVSRRADRLTSEE